MIADLAALETDASLTCDVCVVGSGAAGLAIANELLRSSLRTIVVESGGQELEQETQALYAVESTGAPFPTAETGRFRVFGGTTTRWGGQALPLTPLDFERRDWVAHSGWPLRYEEVAPYYRRAGEFLEIDPRGFDDDFLAWLGARHRALDAASLRYHISKWSPIPSTREIYRDRLAASRTLTVLLHANAGRFHLGEDGEGVVALEVRTLDGRRATVRARSYVIACGGIESARLLLANRDAQGRALGNRCGLLGCFLQDHPATLAGYLRPADELAAQRLFNQFHRGGRKYSVRYSATPELQRSARILNATGAIFFEVGADSPYEQLRRVYQLLRERRYGRELARRLAMVLPHAPTLARTVWDYYVNRRSYTPGAAMRVILNTEQEPNPRSRVTLGSSCDALGMPVASIHWELTELSARTCRVFARVLREELRRVGAGELVLEPWFEDDAADWVGKLADQNHHIGTTRMSESPRDGVVDPTLRVHGMRNLYVASSSVFPTGGHSNPTFTLIALAIRLADHLRTAA